MVDQVELVERVARAIATERHKTLHGLRGAGHSWREHVDEARAAIEAIATFPHPNNTGEV